ncbi:hypothetical protein IAT38_000615 [Cryptococcus sp. DSM 104549]
MSSTDLPRPPTPNPPADTSVPASQGPAPSDPVPPSMPPPPPTTGSAPAANNNSTTMSAGGVLTVTRKQNIACDQCRGKKIRCLRASKADICEQCAAKGTPCTSNYIDGLANKKTRKSPLEDDAGSASGGGSGQKKKRKGKAAQEGETARRNGKGKQREAEEVVEDAGYRNGHEPGTMGAAVAEMGRKVDAVAAGGVFNSNGEGSKRPSMEEGIGDQPVDPLQLLSQITASQYPSLPASIPLPFQHSPPPQTPEEKQKALIRYILSPYPVLTNQYGYTDLASIDGCKRGTSDLWEEQGGAVWDEPPSEAHLGMDDHAMEELVNDLIDMYFAVAHPRNPCFDPPTFRARFRSPGTHPQGPLAHSVLAVALAWGTRFSDHRVVAADRAECTARDTRAASGGSSREGGGEGGRERSRLMQLAVIRAREVAEVNKTFRVPTMENVQALINIENLLGRYQVTYASAAVKHLISLGYNSPRGLLTIPGEKERTEAVFLWWAAVVSDGYRSVFHRLKPILSTEDWDIEPPPDSVLSLPSQPEELDHAVAWLSAAQSGASTCRALAHTLSHPRTPTSGVPLSILRTFIHSASLWRSAYLTKLGVPASWPANWDFLQATSACATDAFHHCLWLVVDRAVGEWGIAEERRGEGGRVAGGVGVEVESVKRRIKEESEHAALRITALVAVLAESGYLRLDALIIHHPIYEAGLHLAQRARPECLACIVALKQYAVSYPGIWAQAEALEEVYARALERGQGQGVGVGLGSASGSGSSSTPSTSHSAAQPNPYAHPTQGHAAPPTSSPLPNPWQTDWARSIGAGLPSNGGGGGGVTSGGISRGLPQLPVMPDTPAGSASVSSVSAAAASVGPDGEGRGEGGDARERMGEATAGQMNLGMFDFWPGRPM